VSELGMRLLLTEPLRPGAFLPQAITFSGGVAEYIYGREAASFGDIARPLAPTVSEATEASLRFASSRTF